MSMMRPFVWLTVLTAAIGFATPASAQFFQPFVDASYLGTPDLQFFAPAEVGEFSGPEPANTGPYFVYERLYLNMTRPEGEASNFSDTNGDWTWGNRWELGYMTEEKTGWQTVIWNLNGPNVGFVNAQHINFDPAGLTNLSVLDQFAIDSLNIATLSSFELNKLWRRKEFHDHSVLDLLLGFRMIQYNDYYRREVTTKGEVGDADLWTIIYDNQLASFENMMYGGQFGGRWFNQRGHWLLSVEARMFALANNQMFTQTIEHIDIDADVTDGDNIRLVGLPEITRDSTNAHRAQFCWGGEVRVEAAYELTRDISLRVGGMFCDMGQGVGRGNLINQNDQDVQIAGVTFGVTINR